MADEGDEYPAVQWDVANISKRCATCKIHFTETNNIGRWQCRVHPLPIVDGAFACCGQPTRAWTREEFVRQTSQPQMLGCRRCDHRADLDVFAGETIIQIPARFLRMLGTRREAVVGIKRSVDVGVDTVVFCSRIETDEHYEQAQRPSRKVKRNVT